MTSDDADDDDDEVEDDESSDSRVSGILISVMPNPAPTPMAAADFSDTVVVEIVDVDRAWAGLG